jgi:polyphosphate:AMP phosphotransferase
MFLSAWYSQPLLRRVHRKDSPARFEEQLEEILAFEKTLADNGMLILKFWMHLGKKAQEKRLKKLEDDPHLNWRVTKQDWANWRKYKDFVSAAEQILMRTSTGQAPWHLVEGVDRNYRSLTVAEHVLDAIQRRLVEHARQKAVAEVPTPIVLENTAHPPFDEAQAGDMDPAPEAQAPRKAITVLSALDMTQALDKKVFNRKLKKLQGQANLLHRQLRKRGTSTVLVFEGWDAGGKGGAIRRVVSALDTRSVRVHPIAAPSDEENAQHYLWRFWRHMPRAGEVAIFDRSWYGRVLVERVEGFANEEEWRRSYAEINQFERQLTQHGIVLVKFWMHITPEEQLERFNLRKEISYKRWKLTDEDWRNRERWDDYESAVHDMVERTSTAAAPWVLVEANDKRFARIKVLRTLCDTMLKAADRA